MHKIRKFILNYKSYIIIFFIIFLSISSIIFQNINSKESLQINDVIIEKNNQEGKIAVYISGEVNNPGVYYLDENSRVNDLIEICGGFTENADISDLNLAELLNDADKIEVARISYDDEYENPDEKSDKENELVNINKATKEELMELPGIGESTAMKIIDYRKNNKFDTIEDLKNVNGIGTSKYNQIKEYISVK